MTPPNSTPAAVAPSPAAAPRFADDLAFLTQHGPVHVLEAPGGGRVALSAKYQGRVMTSAVDPSGRSFGWVHRAFIASGKTATPFDNYGGEDRFWLGPEGGQFALYFPPGKPFAFDDWQVPAALQEGAWELAEASTSRAVFRHAMKLTNWSGTAFSVDVERTIELVGNDAARTVLGFDAAGVPGVKSVAFESRNKITNSGTSAWKRETGLPSVWILAMYAPAADGHVVIPFVPGSVAEKGPIVNDAYFGKVPADRLTVHEDRGFLTFRSDGTYRSKIGLGPARARPVLGSYSAGAKLLTIVSYDVPAPRKSPPPYVNSMWEQQKEPYGGDVVNSYNDGAPAPGKPPLGGFYELETSSPAAELSPGQSLTHTHRTFHFVGEASALEPIAKAVLGVSLSEIK
ncbi:MAG: hypothetical protein JWM74_2179 [Myxococcaceae bacterium]|nr:hypothetical protein [Myxococcaceae bacterium]